MSFNIHFVFDYACFMCVCLKTQDCYLAFLVKTGRESCVAIGNPEQHVRKASHCGIKQQ